MKFAIYSVAVACFALAGALDLAAGEYKSGVAAWLLAAANAVIFLTGR